MSILLSYLVLAWTEPPGPPPTGNVPAPINVGSIQQWKEGGFGVGAKTFDLTSGQIAASRFYDRDNSSYYIDPGNAGYAGLFSGNVGIGTTGAAEKLEVNGVIRIGNTTTNNAGTIKWTGSDFQGYDGSTWKSLTAGSGACFMAATCPSGYETVLTHWSGTCTVTCAYGYTNTCGGVSWQLGNAFSCSTNCPLCDNNYYSCNPPRDRFVCCQQ